VAQRVCWHTSEFPNAGEANCLIAPWLLWRHTSLVHRFTRASLGLAVLVSLALLACTGAHTPAEAVSGGSSGPDPAAVARSLGRGVKFGSMLDAPNEGVWGTVNIRLD